MKEARRWRPDPGQIVWHPRLTHLDAELQQIEMRRGCESPCVQCSTNAGVPLMVFPLSSFSFKLMEPSLRQILSVQLHTVASARRPPQAWLLQHLLLQLVDMHDSENDEYGRWDCSSLFFFSALFNNPLQQAISESYTKRLFNTKI